METTVNKIDSYLSFHLGEEVFAANVAKVLNILEMTKITKVPQSPPYMKGVINLRGTVLPVIDARLRFGMEEHEYDTNTCIIVLEVNVDGVNANLGFIVDSVEEVLEINNTTILPPPSIGNKYKTEFITGVVEENGVFVMILDMDYVFSSDELIHIQNKTEEQPQQNIEDNVIEEIKVIKEEIPKELAEPKSKRKPKKS
jgi:purine-binding chemotaxis protein CheW